MSLINIFGRDTRFFDYLENGAAEARNSATVLTRLLTQLGSSSTETTLGDLAQSRRKHKRIANETTEAVTRVFVTPIDREDIERLSDSLYKISKTIEKVGERLLICPPGAKMENVQQQIADHIAAQPERKRRDMQALHGIIQTLMPDGRLWFLDGKDERGQQGERGDRALHGGLLGMRAIAIGSPARTVRRCACKFKRGVRHRARRWTPTLEVPAPHAANADDGHADAIVGAISAAG